MIKVAAGEYFRLLVEHKQAFGPKANNYLNFSFKTENLPLNLYDGAQKTSLYNVNYSQFDLNYTRVIGTDLSLAAGIRYRRNFFAPEVADNLQVEGNMSTAYAYLRSEAKTINSRLYPTSGYEFSAEAGIAFNRRAQINAFNTEGNVTDVSEIIDGKPEYYRFMLNYARYYSLSRKYVFLYNFQAGLTLNSQGFIFDNFYLGGVQQLYDRQSVFVGLNEGQITTTSITSLLAGLQYNLAGSLFITGKANSGFYNFSTEDKVYDPDEVKWINGFSLGAGYNLSILPMEFTAMYSPEINAVYLHVKIGFLF
jgi:NTE family protein